MDRAIVDRRLDDHKNRAQLVYGALNNR